MYSQQFVKTKRLKIAYYWVKNNKVPKLLLVHGNLSSSVFFLPLFSALSQHYEVAAPDLRCFGDSDALQIDARRGYRDWSDDLDSFVEALGWDKFTIGGWSMGGSVAMQYAIDHGEKVERILLINPGSPYGFGGTMDEKGTPRRPLGLGSGGGCINPVLLMDMRSKNREHVRNIMNTMFFKPPFRLPRVWEEMLIDSSLKTKIGNGKYPGDYRFTYKWPYITPGDRGVLNAMTPNYGNLSPLLDCAIKPPVLWIRGSHDQIVSDNSILELGALGAAGMVPGWPGRKYFPPQPMIKQTRYFLERYRENGGKYKELVIPGGHMCCLESPVLFLSALDDFMS